MMLSKLFYDQRPQYKRKKQSGYGGVYGSEGNILENVKREEVLMEIIE
jgi:hypothetical protein